MRKEIFERKYVALAARVQGKLVSCLCWQSVSFVLDQLERT